jgi:predicted DNA-binding transcriptional regulator YafY
MEILDDILKWSGETMQINRMIEMITILLNKKTVTAKELAERFEVSTRTIYRDIEVLSGAGIPIYTNKGSGGGISLLDHYTLNKTLISDQESESLMVGLATLKATHYPEVDKMLEKIASIFKKNDTSDWIEVDFSAWGADPNTDHKFEDIKGAILQSKLLEFEYINSMQQKAKRQVEPLKLIFKSKEWYMWGFCNMRQELRLFKLSRIKNHKVQKEGFERQQDKLGITIDYFQDKASKAAITLKLRFKEGALYRLYDDFEDNLIQKNEDGTYEVIISFPEGEWLWGYILSYGSDVEVLEPKAVRELISRKLHAAALSYNSL